jgi:hypothetical protein
MLIEIMTATEAQPLDDEGDPVGAVVMLPAGCYRLRSGFTETDDGNLSAWVVSERDPDKLDEARGLRGML